MRVLAIDLGDARTGLAVGDRLTAIAAPAGLIEQPIAHDQGNALIREITRQVHATLGGDLKESEIIMGIPLNMDDTEGPRAKDARTFAQRLANALNAPITLVDERRSSIAADARMAQTGLTHKQKKLRRDAIAASEILQSFLSDETAAIARVEPMIDNDPPN
ncbi:MAG: Holliday junction resolvase RuvX [Phycisphaerales bacterium]